MLTTKSFFTTKCPIHMVNYVYPKHHHQYILPNVKGSNCLLLNARRVAYETAIEQWFSSPISSYHNDQYYEDDNDYYNENEIEETHNIDVNPVTNRFIVESIIEDIISVLNDAGFSINNFNLFKEDLVYFIYRLSNIQHVT